MTLTPGTRLGVYDIVAMIGEGGMGRVYRATDTKLKRQVAIKVLPASVADDGDRLARFQREAEVLASLNHPNIAAIYGLEDAGGTKALVMELVEGDDLSQRIARGRIPLDEALLIATQLADALEAAHEQGIIHRDLKPANIKVRPDGGVKVLDFGLAKALGPSEGQDARGVSQAPTITTPAMTGIGVILGTAAYMAPEQAKGRAVDRRADVWAFGVVLFEMLTGARVFEGDDVTEVIASVLAREPNWSSLPPSTPAAIQRLLRRCLHKDPKKRLAHIGTARFELEEGQATPPEESLVTPHVQPAPRSRPYGWIAAAVLLAAALVGSGMAYRAWSTPLVVARFFIGPPPQTTFVTGLRTGTSARISPDGTRVAFTARDATGRVQMWVRAIDSLTAQPLAGTDDAQIPFWSPDSQFIGFGAQGKLLKIAASGGPTETVCTFPPEDVATGTWSRDGVIVFARGTSPLFIVPAAGGQPLPLTTLVAGHVRHNFPSFLPDGRHVLFSVAGASDEVSGIYATSLDTGDVTRLVAGDTGGLYSPQTGHLLFVRQGTLLAQAFNPKTLTLSDAPTPIADRVEFAMSTAAVAFSVSETGVLAYGTGSNSQAFQMVWVDRQGKATGTAGPQGTYRGLDLAPDGVRIAAHRHEGAGGDIWVTDVSRGITSRFTFDAAQDNSSPIWSPDGSRIVFGSLRAGKWGLYLKQANGVGSEETLLESDSQVLPLSWAPDGRSIVYQAEDADRSGSLWSFPLAAAGLQGAEGRKPVSLLQTPFNESHPQVSPDGKWLAYSSNETGRPEIYLRPFPSGAGKFPVSTRGGLFPRWKGDSRELYYMDAISGGKLMAVEVAYQGSTLITGPPTELFDPRYINLSHTGAYHTYAVSADGLRFLIPRPANAAEAAEAPIVVVLNWAAGLKQ